MGLTCTPKRGVFSKRAPFEVLNLSLVFFGRLTRGEGPEISPLPGFGVQLSRIQTVVAGSEFSNHLSFTSLVYADCEGVLSLTE